MIKLIATDIDGTLFYPKRRITLLTKKNRQFLQEFIKNGGHVCLVSGRTPFISKEIEKVLGMKVDMCACNGSLVIVNNQVINNEPLDKNIVKKLFNEAKNDKNIVAWTFMSNKYPMITIPTRLNFFVRFMVRLVLFFRFKYQEPYTMNNKKLQMLLDDDEAQIYKVMAVCGASKKKIEVARNLLKTYQEKYGNSMEILWSEQALEFMKKDVNKANALKMVLNVLKLHRNEVAVIGDSGNDVPLFEAFENSFVMSHSPEEVKKSAKTIVDGVYQLKDYI